jgi:hypothetical protein
MPLDAAVRTLLEHPPAIICEQRDPIVRAGCLDFKSGLPRTANPYQNNDLNSYLWHRLHKADTPQSWIDEWINGTVAKRRLWLEGWEDGRSQEPPNG